MGKKRRDEGEQKPTGHAEESVKGQRGWLTSVTMVNHPYLTSSTCICT